MNILRKYVHQVGSIYKRLYKDALSTKHKKQTGLCEVNRYLKSP